MALLFITAELALSGFDGSYKGIEALGHSLLHTQPNMEPIESAGGLPACLVAEKVVNLAGEHLFGADHRLLLDCEHAEEWQEPTRIVTPEEFLAAIEESRLAICPEVPFWASEEVGDAS